MNKRKIAVFLEGQTELVFVREFLVKWFDYDSNIIGFDCYHLLRSEFCDAAYTFGDIGSENYYMLVNVGNDCSVLGKIRDRMEHLEKLGYQLVIGLRDMYSTQYIRDAQGRRIDDTVTQLHFNAVKEQIAQMDGGEKVDFHFAIMEVEAWLLGMHRFLQTVDEKLTPEYVVQNAGIDLEDNPETSFFHPAAALAKIYGLAGKMYDKHETDISSIMASLQVEDFKKLVHSGYCQSFKSFVESLLGGPVRFES